MCLLHFHTGTSLFRILKIDTSLFRVLRTSLTDACELSKFQHQLSVIQPKKNPRASPLVSAYGPSATACASSSTRSPSEGDVTWLCPEPL